MNSPRSEDLCQLPVLLHHTKSVFCVRLQRCKPRSIFPQKLPSITDFPLTQYPCWKGQSESITFLAVAHFSLHSIDSIGECVVICATRSAGGGVSYTLFTLNFYYTVGLERKGGQHSGRWA